LTLEQTQALGLGELAIKGYGHPQTSDATTLGLLEFASYKNPYFFLLLDQLEKVVGYLTFETIGKYENGDSHAYWDTILALCPGVHALYDTDKSLQIAIVDGIIVDKDHRANGTAEKLLEYGLSIIGPEVDVLIGLTKNPAAVKLRRTVIEKLNNRGTDFQFYLWVGLQQLIGAESIEDTSKAQELVLLLSHLYSMTELQGWGMDGHPEVSVIPPIQIGSLPRQPYLPSDFYKSVDQLDEESREWLQVLYDTQPLLAQGNVALLPLIAISRDFLSAAMSGPVSSQVFKTERSGIGRRYRRVLLRNQELMR
jgi:hypothetical protein